MINKSKLGLFVLTMLLVLGVVSQANAAALNWTADQTVDLSSPDVNLTILAGSAATSLVVNTGGIDVVVPSGSTFTITSASRDLVVSGATSADVVQSCSSAFLKTVAIYGGVSGETITLSAYSSECTPPSGSGGGGGGGGGGNIKKVIPAVPANTTPSTDCLPGFKFSPSTGRNCNAATPATPASPSAKWYNFGTTTLKNGSKGEGVKELQRFLNAKLNLGLVVDGKLGPKTIAVIKKWQKDNGLVADGLIGPKTKVKMNAQAAQ